MLMYVSMRRHVDCPKFQKRTAARRRTSDIMGREKQTNIYIYIYIYNTYVYYVIGNDFI